MTKKDYVLIANSIFRTKQVTELTEGNKLRKRAKIDAIRLLASDIAGSLYGENKKFDRNRFLKDCGIQD